VSRWLDRESGRSTATAFQNSVESFHNKPAFGRCCPSVRRVALWLHVITIIRSERPNPEGWCPDGWTGARNFHIWSLIVRTMKTAVQTVELCMQVLPYREHCPDGSSRLPITVSWGRNPNSCQTLNGIQTDALEHWDLLNTDGRPDDLPLRPDGYNLELFEASRHWWASERKDLVVRTDDALTEGRPDGNPRRLDGWCFGQLGVRTGRHVVRTADREPNFLTYKLCRIFWQYFWIAESLLNSIITMKWFCPTECGQLQTNKLPLWPFWDKNHMTG
jgi:hypothetical protein